MRRLFIADLHLQAARPDLTRRLLDLLAHEQGRCDELYILGDLFELWLGDDLIPPEYLPVLAALRAFSAAGGRCYVQHGNRDFLLGAGFAARSGCQLLAERHTLELAGRRTLLLHGDTLVSDDIPYQQMRLMLRNPTWIDAFLAKPPAERIAFARSLREKSREEVSTKAYAIMDVHRATLLEHCRASGAQWVIHGHTHRPGVHLEGGIRRYVLGDWRREGAWVLVCEGAECRLHHL